MSLLQWLATVTLGPACPLGCGYRTRTRGHKTAHPTYVGSLR